MLWTHPAVVQIPVLLARSLPRITDDVIDLVEAEEVPQMCILAHPNRWCDDAFGWTKELIYQNVKNIGKAGIVWYRNRNNKG